MTCRACGGDSPFTVLPVCDGCLDDTNAAFQGVLQAHFARITELETYGATHAEAVQIAEAEL